jgi:hypothetical protein
MEGGVVEGFAGLEAMLEVWTIDAASARDAVRRARSLRGADPSPVRLETFSDLSAFGRFQRRTARREDGR